MGISTINDQDLPQSTTPPATATPTISLSSATPVFGKLTVTVSNHANYTNPNYSAECTLADGTVTVTDANIDRNLESDGSHLASTLDITDANASTAQRTITVKAQEFEDRKQSAGVTATYTPSFIQSKYIRIRGVDSSGNNSASYMGISDIRFYTAGAQSGTAYPTTNLTANDSETGIVISAGHFFSDFYAPWKACDAVTTNSGGMWWSLQASAANNFWQIEFEDGTYSTKPIIKSVLVHITQFFIPTHIKITGSDNADHSSATDYGTFAMSIPSSGTTQNTFG